MSINPRWFYFAAITVSSFTLLSSAFAQGKTYTPLSCAEDFLTYGTQTFGPEYGITWGAYGAGPHTGYAPGASFFTQSLMQAYGYESKDIFGFWSTTTPSSGVYYSYINAGIHFTRITHINDIEPGDIIVLNSSSQYRGHTAFIADFPTKIIVPLNPIVANTIQYQVLVVDWLNEATPHGCTDSRWIGPCNFASATQNAGPGTGYMRFYVDASGALVGHTWSVTPSFRSYYQMNMRPYVIGRFEP